MTANDGIKPLVAIVTPVYNGAKYLAETMECVQAQTYSNLVHIVLDNASTDETPAIVERFRGRRVPLLVARNEKTLPLGDNWNAAVALVPRSASYFRLLCADDLLRSDYVSRKVALAEAHRSIAIVGCQWRAEGLCGEELPRDREVFTASEILRAYLRRETSALSGTAVLFRADLLSAAAPFFDTSLMSLDTDAQLRSIVGRSYGFIHEELAVWRQHAASVTSTVVANERHFLTEWLVLLDRYGQYALEPDELAECQRNFRRYLVRRLLLTRFRDGRKDAYRRAAERMAAVGHPLRTFDFVDALAEWACLAATGRRALVGMPRQSTRQFHSKPAAHA